MKLCLSIALLLVCSSYAIADELGVTSSNAWVREGPPGVMMMAAYLKLENHSPNQRTLQAASSAAFRSVEVHTTIIENDVARMRHVPELVIAAGEFAELRPSAMHLMLMGPVKPLKAGDTVEIQLDFGESGRLSVQFPVRRPD